MDVVHNDLITIRHSCRDNRCTGFLNKSGNGNSVIITLIMIAKSWGLDQM